MIKESKKPLFNQCDLVGLSNNDLLSAFEILNTEIHNRNIQSRLLESRFLKLPHWDTHRLLSPLQYRVIKAAWGNASDPSPPVVSWQEIKFMVFTTINSLPKVFGKNTEWQDFFNRVGHGAYQLRR